MAVKGGRLIVDPKKKPRYDLAELLSSCRRSDLAPLRKDRSWRETGPVGREEL